MVGRGLPVFQYPAFAQRQGRDTDRRDDFVGLGGEAKARDAGKLRQEGKQYVVQDGDVMLFKFNV